MSENSASVKKAKKPSYLQLADLTWTSRETFRDIYLLFTSPVDFEVETLDIAVLGDDFYREISKNELAHIFVLRTLKIGTLSAVQILRAIIEYHRKARELGRSQKTWLDAKTCVDHASYLLRTQHLLGKSDRQNLRDSFHVVDLHLGRVVAVSQNVLKDRDQDNHS